MDEMWTVVEKKQGKRIVHRIILRSGATIYEGEQAEMGGFMGYKREKGRACEQTIHKLFT